MELKFYTGTVQAKIAVRLLIVPYGIEIDNRGKGTRKGTPSFNRTLWN